MSTTVKQSFAFGTFLMDLEEHQLLKDGEPVPVTDKVLDLLVLLVQNRGHIVDSEEILTTLWAETSVGEENVKACILEARRVLGENASNLEYIETVAGRGYRFVAGVNEVAPEAGQRLRKANESEDYPLTKIRRLATDMGVTDLSTYHREYAHDPSQRNPRES